MYYDSFNNSRVYLKVRDLAFENWGEIFKLISFLKPNVFHIAFD